MCVCQKGEGIRRFLVRKDQKGVTLLCAKGVTLRVPSDVVFCSGAGHSLTPAPACRQGAGGAV